MLLRASGVEFEADVSFSALNQLLLPLRHRLGELDPIHASGLAAALGLDAGQVSEGLVVSNAALALLELAASERPLLMLVDDAQWFDRPSARVLGFVARRLAGSRIGLVASVRSEDDGFFTRSGLQDHELQPLTDPDADALLDLAHPNLAPSVKRRVLAQAEGYPLALLELPEQLSRQQQAAEDELPSMLPLGRRLRKLFAAQVATLPDDARRLLLVAALEGSGDLEILERVAPDKAQMTLAPAERARLIQLLGRAILFRHPMVRSAVVELATYDELRAAHRLLAEATGDTPDRRAWHLAEATIDPNEEIASLLEASAHRILARGDRVGAVASLTRSAQLTPDDQLKGKRLAKAAYIGADVTGNLRSVSQVLAGGGTDVAPSLEAAVAAAYFVLNGDGNIATAHGLLAGAIDAATDGREADAMTFEALHTLMLVCFFGGHPGPWRQFDATLARLAPHVPRALGLCARTFADPARADESVLDRLDAAIRELHHESDPTKIVRTGMAAFYVDRLSPCREAFWRVVRDGREGGAVASAIDALLLLAFDDFLTGNWTETNELVAEALELCETSGTPSWRGREGSHTRSSRPHMAKPTPCID